MLMKSTQDWMTPAWTTILHGTELSSQEPHDLSLISGRQLSLCWSTVWAILVKLEHLCCLPQQRCVKSPIPQRHHAKISACGMFHAEWQLSMEMRHIIHWMPISLPFLLQPQFESNWSCHWFAPLMACVLLPDPGSIVCTGSTHAGWIGKAPFWRYFLAAFVSSVHCIPQSSVRAFLCAFCQMPKVEKVKAKKVKGQKGQRWTKSKVKKAKAKKGQRSNVTCQRWKVERQKTKGSRVKNVKGQKGRRSSATPDGCRLRRPTAVRFRLSHVISNSKLKRHTDAHRRSVFSTLLCFPLTSRVKDFSCSLSQSVHVSHFRSDRMRSHPTG